MLRSKQIRILNVFHLLLWPFILCIYIFLSAAEVEIFSIDAGLALKKQITSFGDSSIWDS